ncbi:hypothetical protein NECAME_10538 [Necator americanus]|uniref:Transthyretin-like family protein n=1 Tax=Necator americanus TaxID=51031 RepID=W2T8F1_NECAM|nr:hypothetical protein NECAME_10538 [Necator americanus]ETN78163.1 hypothetical protein NECAME_10538 [Necator americanus]
MTASWIFLVVITTANSSFCGKSGVPFSVEVLPSGVFTLRQSAISFGYGPGIPTCSIDRLQGGIRRPMSDRKINPRVDAKYRLSTTSDFSILKVFPKKHPISNLTPMQRHDLREISKVSARRKIIVSVSDKDGVPLTISPE